MSTMRGPSRPAFDFNFETSRLGDYLRRRVGGGEIHGSFIWQHLKALQHKQAPPVSHCEPLPPLLPQAHVDVLPSALCKAGGTLVLGSSVPRRRRFEFEGWCLSFLNEIGRGGWSLDEREGCYGYHPFGILLVPPGPRAWPGHVYVGEVERDMGRGKGGKRGRVLPIWRAPIFEFTL